MSEDERVVAMAESIVKLADLRRRRDELAAQLREALRLDRQPRGDDEEQGP